MLFHCFRVELGCIRDALSYPDIDSEPIGFSMFSHEALAILVVYTLGGWGTSF